MGFLGKFIEKYQGASPIDRAKVKAGALTFCGLFYVVIDELIFGRPMKALGIFLFITLCIGTLVLLGYICMRIGKLIGENAAVWLCAAIVIAIFFGGVYFVLLNWGK